MADTITFGQWVKQRRKALGLTQSELGNLVACSKVMIIKIEGDERRPSIDLAMLLARSLKIPPAERSAFLILARPDQSLELLSERSAPASRALPRSLNRRIANLPNPPTPLVGRAEEVTTISSLLLDPDVRLVTLTGAGGIGKTRLSLQVATELHEQFVDGAWFVSLAAVEDSDLVIPTIARGLGIKESRDRTIYDALLDYLINKDMLLVLDNFEQVMPAARKIAEILIGTTGLKVLVTSRTVLHISGEYEFIVPPLRFVDVRNAPSRQELEASPAVALFVQRARAVNINFKLTPENYITVAKICARLDGLSLAIELAASHIKFLTPAALLSRLDGSSPEGSSLNLLVGGGHDLPMRQQTMRHAIDWSYNLLNESEQALFRHLAVFSGGCTLDAVTAICSDLGNPTVSVSSSPAAQRTFSARLASLVDQSILRLESTPSGEPRFGMIEALHEYALERLMAHGKEWPLLKRRHAQYFMALAEVAEPGLESAEQETWLSRLEVEHDNFLAALTWSHTSDDQGEIGLKLAGVFWQFWLIRGYINEGLVWFSRLLEQAQSPSKLVLARALNGYGFLNWAWSDSPRAKMLLAESLALFRELDNPHGTAWVLNHLGHVAFSQHQIEEAAGLVRESLALFKKLGSDAHVAWCLLNLGDIVRAQGDEAQATLCYDECLRLFRKVGDPRGMAWVLDHLADHLLHKGPDEGCQKALPLLEESLALFRKVGDKGALAWVMTHQGKFALTQNDLEQAQILLEESLGLFREVSSLRTGAWAAVELGDFALKLGNQDHAAVIFHQALNLFYEVDDPDAIAQLQERLNQIETAKP